MIVIILIIIMMSLMKITRKIYDDEYALDDNKGDERYEEN